MCFTPKAPTLTPVPSLQAVKAPTNAAPTDDSAERRRRAGYMATILANTTGSAPATTNAGAIPLKATLGA